MPNNNTIPAVDLEIEEDDDFDPTDYGFIISADGELKSIMYPEDLMEDPPEEIKLIMQIFGIADIETLDNRTLH
jgi:hypothetical protein